MRRLMLATWLALALIAGGAVDAAKPSMQEVLRATFAVHDFDGVDLSPGATAVLWQETFRNAQTLNETRRHTALYLQQLGAISSVRLTAGNGKFYADEEQPVWSPDGKRIAFLSDARSKNQLQLFIADAAGRNARRVTHFDGNVQGVKWSPDSRFIAVLYIAKAHRKAGALAPGERDVGVIGSRLDEQRLTTVNVATGVLKQLTPPDVYVYEYGWSPDSRQIAATYAHGNGDNNWWIAKLATVDASTGTMRELLTPKYQIDDPQWSPDGKQIALIHGIMSDFGSTGGDIYLVNATTGTVRNALPGMSFSAQSLRWEDPAHVQFVAHVNGSMRLLRLTVATRQVATLTDRDEAIWSWSNAQKGRVVAMVRSSFDNPPEVWAGPPDALKQISHSNSQTTRLWGKAQSISWKSDTYSVQGWLVYPLSYDPNKKYPMVTIIHGGPSAESVPSYANRNLAALSSQGYFVFMPNPRGSFGQGEAFTAANVQDFGYGDWRDDLSGVDAALKVAPLDAKRLGLFGWSYGGYMGMWAETQTFRFKGIVAGAGVANWQSYYGQNKIDEWMIPFFGASVYQDPQVYAKSSPITFINQSKTPVLILQGEYDEEVPAPQAFEFWHAMKTLGVPTELVVYANEGHGPRKPANQIDIMTRMVGWFDRYLQ